MALNYAKLIKHMSNCTGLNLVAEGKRYLKIKKMTKGHLNVMLDNNLVGRIDLNGTLTLTSDKEFVSTILSKYLESL